MMGLGPWELIIIFMIVLVIFGVNKLPQLGEALGKSIKNFKQAADGKDEIDVTPKKEIEGETKRDGR